MKYRRQQQYDSNNSVDNSSNIFNVCNPYGYKLNINNKEVYTYFLRYVKWKGLSPHFPLSDKERLEFEDYILPKFLNR